MQAKLKRPDPTRVEALVRGLERKISEAKDAESTALREIGEAGLAVEERDSSGPARLERARKAHDGAKAHVAELEAALASARRRYDGELKALKAEETAEQWARTAEVADRRVEVAVKLEAGAKAQAALLKELLHLGEVAHALAPSTDTPLLGSLLAPSRVTAEFSTFLVGLGWKWAGKGHPFGFSFVERIRDSSRWVLKARPRENVKAAKAVADDARLFE